MSTRIYKYKMFYPLKSAERRGMASQQIFKSIYVKKTKPKQILLSSFSKKKKKNWVPIHHFVNYIQCNNHFKNTNFKFSHDQLNDVSRETRPPPASSTMTFNTSNDENNKSKIKSLLTSSCRLKWGGGGCALVALFRTTMVNTCLMNLVFMH